MGCNVRIYHDNRNCKNSLSDLGPTWTNPFLASPWAASVSLMVEESLATKASTSSWATSYFSLEVDILAFVSSHFTISSSWRTNYQFLVSSQPRCQEREIARNQITYITASNQVFRFSWLRMGGRKWVQCSRIKAKLGVVFSWLCTVHNNKLCRCTNCMYVLVHLLNLHTLARFESNLGGSFYIIAPSKIVKIQRSPTNTNMPTSQLIRVMWSLQNFLICDL